jgi:hypothetical protein
MNLQQLQNRGRNGDTMVAHLTPGEVVIPKEVAAMRPDIVRGVGQQVKSMGGNPSTLVAGRGRINPQTGVEEFATEAEVRAMYQSVLGREADAGGLANWMNQADLSGFKAAAAPELVEKAYQTSFGRPADQAGKTNWVNAAQADQNFDYGTIKNSAVGADIKARDDIAAGGVDTAKTWGDGASLTDPNLDYNVEKNTWGKKLTTPVVAAPVAPSLKDATHWNVTNDQTVAGQLEKVLASDSPLIQQARSRAMQSMNARGLTNSSLAASAADDAMYNSALKIATPDASTYASAAKSNTDADNTFATASNAYSYDLGKIQAQAAASAQTAKDVANIEAQYKNLTQGSASATSILNKMQDSLNYLMNNTSITDQAVRDSMAAQIKSTAMQSLSMIGALAGDVDLSTFMDSVGA